MEISSASLSSTTSEMNNNHTSEKKITSKKSPKFVLSTKKKLKNCLNSYICSIDDCQQLFQSRQELIEHQKTHIKIHKCPLRNCNKSFKEIINLRKHYKQHFPTEKRYVCPHEGCGKSFTTSYNLTIHYRIHIAKKPYKCNKCEKVFFDKDNYKYHITSKHVNNITQKLICQHKDCKHKSQTIKQKLMHHDKLEEFCVQEKNLLFNLILMFKKSIVFLFKEEDNKNGENKDIIKAQNIDADNSKDYKFIKEMESFDLDDDLKKELNNIILQSKTLIRCAINQDQYKDLIDE